MMLRLFHKLVPIDAHAPMDAGSMYKNRKNSFIVESWQPSRLGGKNMPFPKNTSSLLLTLLWVSLGCASCTRVYYQPTPWIYSLPDDLSIDWVAYRIETASNNLTQPTLSAWELLPTFEKASKPETLSDDETTLSQSRGTVLHFHGNAQNMSAHYLYVAWLTSFKYRVITFDYRGYGQSTGQPEAQGLVQDGLTMIRWVCERFQPDGPIYILAQSLGGAKALASLARFDQLNSTAQRPLCIDGVIFESTFSSYKAITQDKLASFWLTWPLQKPLTWLAAYDKASIEPIDQLKHLRPRPALFIDGVSDPIVPGRFGEHLYRTYPGSVKDRWLVKRPGHLRAFGPGRPPERQRLVNYLKRLAE